MDEKNEQSFAATTKAKMCEVRKFPVLAMLRSLGFFGKFISAGPAALQKVCCYESYGYKLLNYTHRRIICKVLGWYERKMRTFCGDLEMGSNG